MDLALCPTHGMVPPAHCHHAGGFEADFLGSQFDLCRLRVSLLRFFTPALTLMASLLALHPASLRVHRRRLVGTSAPAVPPRTAPAPAPRPRPRIAPPAAPPAAPIARFLARLPRLLRRRLLETLLEL